MRGLLRVTRVLIVLVRWSGMVCIGGKRLRFRFFRMVGRRAGLSRCGLGSGRLERNIKQSLILVCICSSLCYHNDMTSNELHNELFTQSEIGIALVITYVIVSVGLLIWRMWVEG